jgi:hypothetical protein
VEAWRLGVQHGAAQMQHDGLMYIHLHIWTHVGFSPREHAHASTIGQQELLSGCMLDVRLSLSEVARALWMQVADFLGADSAPLAVETALHLQLRQQAAWAAH